MVAAPLKKKHKIKRYIKKRKKMKRNKSKSVILAICRRCCVAGKWCWDTQQVAGKKDLTSKETHPIMERYY